MNNILKSAVAFSVVAALAACAQKPGQKPKPQTQAQAQNGGVDKLASKPAGDVLSEKYKTLTANCELKSAAVATEESVVSTDPAPPAEEPAPELPPVPQPVLNGLKLSYDVKEQARIDSSMKKTLIVDMQPEDRSLKVSLALRPVDFESPQVEAVGSLRRLRKHSPYMIIFANVSQVAADGAVGEPAVTFIKLRESVQTDTVLNGSNMVLSCMLQGEISKPEYKNQNLDIDCANQNPPDELKEIYRATCQPAEAQDVPPAK